MYESSPTNAAEVAKRLAELLDSRQQEYAMGGAIALGYWGVLRGTVDVDVTIYLPPDRPSECVWLLQEIGCEVSSASATASLREQASVALLSRACKLTFSFPRSRFMPPRRNVANGWTSAANPYLSGTLKH